MTSTNAAYASNDLSCDYSYAICSTSSVSTRANEAYSKYSKKTPAEDISPGDAFDMDKNPTYGLSVNTPTQYKTTTANTDPIATANQAYGCFEKMACNVAPGSNNDTANNLYEDCHIYI